MRLVVQRVKKAWVETGGKRVSEIGAGFLVLAGFGAYDSFDLPQTRVWGTMLGKVLDLRVFPDEQGRLNVGIRDFGGEVLAVSQFTLYADCRKGRRPSFHPAAPPDEARDLYERLVLDLSEMWPGRVKAGIFAAEMDVGLVNWGPVTIVLDSDDFA